MEAIAKAYGLGERSITVITQALDAKDAECEEKVERVVRAADKMLSIPAIWCLEELCKDRTCPTCKAGHFFQRDMKIICWLRKRHRWENIFTLREQKVLIRQCLTCKNVGWELV